MKKGISAPTILVTIGLTVIVVLIMTIFTGQQIGKTEQNFFVKLINKFFPSKIESIVIPGTTVGAGCPVVTIEGVDMLAQATIDCWKQGKKFSDNVQCCYAIDPKNLKTTITDSNLREVLTKRGVEVAGKIAWKITPLSSSTPVFTVCYDYNLFADEVYLTFYPKGDCS